MNNYDAQQQQQLKHVDQIMDLAPELADQIRQLLNDAAADYNDAGRDLLINEVLEDLGWQRKPAPISQADIDERHRKAKREQLCTEIWMLAHGQLPDELIRLRDNEFHEEPWNYDIVDAFCDLSEQMEEEPVNFPGSMIYNSRRMQIALGRLALISQEEFVRRVSNHPIARAGYPVIDGEVYEQKESWEEFRNRYRKEKE